MIIKGGRLDKRPDPWVFSCANNDLRLSKVHTMDDRLRNMKEKIRRELEEDPTCLDQWGSPVLTALGIEINSFCNRKCVWCPNHNHDREIAFLDDRIFYKIIDELKEMEFKGKITFNDFNEPLLDKRLVKFIEYTRRSIPSTSIYLNTNGDLLTLDMWNELRNAGLDYAIISQYDGRINENIQTILNKLD